MRNREKQRANRKKKRQQQALLEMRNMYGNKDLTPYNASLQIKTGGKSAIVLK